MSPLETCPKCGKPVTSIHESGNKRFYNHGQGGTMGWEPGQVFVLKFDPFYTVEIATTATDGKSLD